MSAGIKIYNHNRQVLINSQYQNIALLQVIDTSNIDKTELTFGSEPIVVVEQLLPSEQPRARVRLVYDGVYKLFINNQAKATQKICVFGMPDNSKITQKSGLIIYQNNTGKIAFDSRLRYLQLLGEMVNDAPADANKTYGIIKRVPVNDNERQWNTGRSRGRYYFRRQKWHEEYGIENGKFKIFNKYTSDYESYFVDRPVYNHDLTHEIKYKPLLVDLTSII